MDLGAVENSRSFSFTNVIPLASVFPIQFLKSFRVYDFKKQNKTKQRFGPVKCLKLVVTDVVHVNNAFFIQTNLPFR